MKSHFTWLVRFRKYGTYPGRGELYLILVYRCHFLEVHNSSIQCLKFQDGFWDIAQNTREHGRSKSYDSLVLLTIYKPNSYSNARVFFLSLYRMRISVFWGHEHLTDRLISKHYPRAKSLHELKKKFNFKSVSHSWHMIPLVIWKHSAWTFYRYEWRLSLNENTAAHRKAIKNTSFRVWIQLFIQY